MAKSQKKATSKKQQSIKTWTMQNKRKPENDSTDSEESFDVEQPHKPCKKCTRQADEGINKVDDRPGVEVEVISDDDTDDMRSSDEEV
jgi:hypothetical protein